ncbi:sulfite exporter TauE/SafE family protein [bacterium]|nr:sulfite exporter TauE/SafE family protein [bacterium]
MIYLGYALIGLAAGVLGGFVGVGGGIIIVPALLLLFGYDQLKAQGTSLAFMLPPIGILGFLQYWRNPAVQIDFWAVAAIGGTFIVGGYFGGRWANALDPVLMRKSFAVFLLVTAVYLFFKPK